MSKQQTNLLEKKELSKRERKKAEKEFTDTMLGVFRPKIVMPGYTDMPIPKPIQESITIERLLMARQQEKLATETETLWYLSTASLVAPFDRDWSEIMMYLCRKWLISRKKERPDFLKEQIVLTDLQERDLHNIRTWLYKKGMEAIRTKERQGGV